MEALQEFPAVEISKWFPCIFVARVSFPLNEVSLTIPVVVYDLFDFILVVFLLLVVERGLQRGARVCGFQQGYMEHWMDLCVRWKLESVANCALLFGNQKWSDFDVIQFLCLPLCFQVLR